MNTAVNVKDAMTTTTLLKDAATIPYVTLQEAEKLGLEELRRLLALADGLDKDDWSRPTACTLWNVRDMLAHQAGSFASGTGYREMFHQYSAVARVKGGQAPEDAINERQLSDRANRTPAELAGEIRAAGEQAVSNWAYRFRAAKLTGIPHPKGFWLGTRHLMLVIHSRDTWMHRLDICRATGRPFEMTPEHDARITELAVLDLARLLARKLGDRAIALELTGIAGGSWRIGRGEPGARIRMDTLDFHVYASQRMTYADATRCATLSGDRDLAMQALREFYVLY